MSLFLCLLASAVVWWGRHLSRAPGPLSAATTAVVRQGGTSGVAATLFEQGVIIDPRAFTLVTWITRLQGPLRAGEYLFPANASLHEVLGILRNGHPIQRWLTIPEGLTASQILLIVEQADGMIGDLPPLDEGEVLPDTYAYRWGDQRIAVLRRAARAMQAALTDAWERRELDLPFSSSREALILASIVERETGRPEERQRVASVFVNRLRKAMPLQSDPTVAYAVSNGGALSRALTKADLNYEHPFNTYRNRGLPPAPISSPGRDSLAAVMHPGKTNDLYFVADGEGGHVFSSTLEEHNRNVARWRAGAISQAR